MAKRDAKDNGDFQVNPAPHLCGLRELRRWGFRPHPCKRNFIPPTESRGILWCGVKTKIVLAFISFLCSVFFTLYSAFAFCYEEAGLEYNINPVLLHVISKTESNLNQMAINTNPNGTQDIGLMQINSSWVKSLNLDADLLLSDPCYNLKTGAEILSKCIEQYGYRWEAIGCYNAVSKDKRVKYSWKIFKELVTSNELRVTSYNKIGKKDAPAKNTKFYFKVKDKLNNYEKDSSLVTNDSLLSLEAQ